MEIIQQHNKAEIQRAIEECDCAFGRYELPLSRREYYPEFLDKVSRYANFFVAYDGAICGCVAMYANDPSGQAAYITLMVVHPDKQGMGISKLLLDTCVGRAKANGMKFLRLEVKEQNKEAISLYLGYGFRFEERASEDSFHMVLRLDEA